jgi:hypothetical protein
VCAATQIGRPQSALRKLAILQSANNTSKHHFSHYPTAAHPSFCSCCSVSSLHLARQTMTDTHTHTGQATKALHDHTIIEAPILPAYRLGFGLHRCQTLLPRAAAYLRSLHQPGICIRVAPKMRKRPTSCAADKAHAHHHRRMFTLPTDTWGQHAACWSHWITLQLSCTPPSTLPQRYLQRPCASTTHADVRGPAGTAQLLSSNL